MNPYRDPVRLRIVGRAPASRVAAQRDSGTARRSTRPRFAARHRRRPNTPAC